MRRFSFGQAGGTHAILRPTGGTCRPRGTSRLPSPHRFLGFGFAAADLLLEVTPDGRVSFALGAGEAVLGVPDQALADRPLAEPVRPRRPSDGRGAVQRPRSDGTARRARGRVRVGGQARRARQPDRHPPAAERGRISCALSRASGRGAARPAEPRSLRGPRHRAAGRRRQDLELAFVELAGLSASSAAPPSDPGPGSRRLRRRRAARAQAYRGEARDRRSARTATPWSAAVTSRPRRVARRIAPRPDPRRRGQCRGHRHLRSPMTGVRAASRRVQALRFALGLVAEGAGCRAALPGDLAQAPGRGRAGHARQRRRPGRRDHATAASASPTSRWCRSTDGGLHHHEVLVRFGVGGQPLPAHPHGRGDGPDRGRSTAPSWRGPTALQLRPQPGAGGERLRPPHRRARAYVQGAQPC